MTTPHKKRKRNELRIKILIVISMVGGYIALNKWKDAHIAERVRIESLPKINLVKLNAKNFSLEYYRTNLHYQTAKVNN